MKLSLAERKTEIKAVETFIFNTPADFSWQPGQYMHYSFPHQSEDDRGHERYFTISSAPFEKHISITTRFTDDTGSSFKKALLQMQVGQEIEADGPRGSFFIDENAQRHILIAGGIGITPYRAQLLQMDHDGKDINAELLYANRDELFVFDDEFKALEAKHPRFKVKKYVGEQRISEDDLKAFNNDNTVFYISGPRPMVEAYQNSLVSMGVAEERVKTDYFPGYQLG